LFRIAHTEEEKKQKQQGSEEHLCEEVVSEEVKVVREVGGYSWIVWSLVIVEQLPAEVFDNAL
jgi:hypothetical protein